MTSKEDNKEKRCADTEDVERVVKELILKYAEVLRRLADK